MKISWSPYKLKLKKVFGGGFASGALIRARYDNGRENYSVLHPWPNLGDPTLKSIIHDLKQGFVHPLIYSALKIDTPLQTDISVPCHDLIQRTSRPLQTVIEEGLTKGFTYFKIKMGEDIKLDLEQVKSVLSIADIKLRIDINSIYSLKHAVTFLKTLAPFNSQIDFVEDITRFDEKQWRKLQKDFGIQLAYDIWEGSDLQDPSAFRIVEKPIRGVRVHSPNPVFTSALEHAFGVMQGLIFSQSETEPQGFASFRVYDSDRYSELLKVDGGKVVLTSEAYQMARQFLTQEKWSDEVSIT